MVVFVAFVVPGLSFVGLSIVFVAFVVFVGFWHFPEGLSLQTGLPGTSGPYGIAPGRGFFLHETICMKRSRCSKISKRTALESLNSHRTLLRVVSLSQSETDSHAL